MLHQTCREDVYINKIQRDATVCRCLLLQNIQRDATVCRCLLLQNIQRDATVCRCLLLQNYSTRFGCPSRPSSGVHQTVTAASGTGHSIRAMTFCQRCLIRPRWQKVVALILWPIPEAAVTVWGTPDDGRGRRPKHVEKVCSNKHLHTVASCWILLIYNWNIVVFDCMYITQ